MHQKPFKQTPSPTGASTTSPPGRETEEVRLVMVREVVADVVLVMVTDVDAEVVLLLVVVTWDLLLTALFYRDYLVRGGGGGTRIPTTDS